MSQRATHHQQINAPFRAKSAAVSLVVILMISVYYFANALSMLPSGEAIPDGALRLAITAVVLVAVVEAVLHIVLFIGAGKTEERSERDTVIAARAARNAYFVMVVGALAAFGTVFGEFTAFEVGNVVLAALFLAEIVNYGSQVMYYRHSA